jgi:protein CpxP
MPEPLSDEIPGESETQMRNFKTNYPPIRAGVAAAAMLFCAAAVPVMAQEPAAPVSQTAPPADAQPSLPTEARGRRGPAGGDMQERQVEMLTKQLSLTPDQVSKLKAIDADSRQQLMALRDDTSTSREQKRPKMMEIRDAQQAKVKAMLTDDQKTKYEAVQAKMRERMRDRRNGDGNGPPAPPQ